MRTLYRGNPLAFPGGVNPGFDPSHVAARNCLFSAAAAPNGFINCLNGKPGTVGGSPTNEIRGGMGPAVVFTTNADTTFALPSTSFNQGTMAAIFRCAGTTGSPQYILNNIATSSMGIGISLVGNSDFGYVLGGTSRPSLIPYVANAPYFFAVSFNGSVGASLIAIRLDTGAIITFASTSQAGGAGDGNIYLGNRGLNTRQLNGSIAAAMFSNVYLSPLQLLAWAQSPWDFWYPPTVQNLLFSGLGGASSALTAALVARSIAMGKSFVSMSGAVPIAATLRASSISTQALSGKVQLTGRITSSATTRAQAGAAAALAAKVKARAAGKASLAGKVPLSANAKALATARAGLAGAVALATRAAAMGKAKASPAGALGLVVKSAGVATARATMGASAALLAITARVGAMAQARATMGVGASLVALSAGIGAASHTRAAMTAKAALAARSAAAAVTRSAAAGAIALTIRTAAMSRAKASVPTLIAALAARSIAIAKSSSSPIGKVGLSARSMAKSAASAAATGAVPLAALFARVASISQTRASLSLKYKITGRPLINSGGRIRLIANNQRIRTLINVCRNGLFSG